jgi:subtilisin-like proprotein convertase family protein
MQPKFTLKKFLKHFQKKALLLLFFMPLFANAQVVLSTAAGTDYNGALSVNNPAPLTVSFVVQNTNAFPIVLSSVSCQMAPFGTISAAGDASNTRLLVSSTSLSGSYDLSTPAWTQIATGSAVVPATVTSTPVITGISYSIPANTQLRFAVELTKGLRISGPFAGFNMPTPNVFTAAGVNLKLGNNQISGANVGWGGVAPAPTNEPTFFGGSITFSSGTACTGTPNPGATTTSPSSVCSGQSFGLFLPALVPSTGLTYQWQSGTSSTGPWTDISGATGSSHIASNRSLWYRCNVTCGTNSGASTPVQPAATNPIFCYCAAGATSTSFEKISRVAFNTINNPSTSTAGYENFRAISTVAYRGVTSPITVTLSGGFSADQVLVWIDFNQNGDFSDAGELVYTSTLGAGPHTGNITIPATALTGATAMRVRMHDSSLGGNTASCGNSTYGQVEDYSLDIQNCTPLTITASPVNSTIICGQNASFTAAATGSAAIAYQWQFKANATAAWTNITAATSPVYSGFNSATLNLTAATQAFSGYQYRAIVTNPCSGPEFSNAATLTVNSLVPVVSPASATICNGTVQALTLTNTVGASTTTTFNATSGLPLTVPDDNTAVGILTSPLAISGIPAGSVINNIAVRFSMTHTYVGDLNMNLKAPNGQVMNLFAQLDGGAGSNTSDNFVNTVVDSLSTTPMSGAPAPRTGTYRADKFTVGATLNAAAPTTTNSWLPLLGTINGNWQLAISDPYAGDQGLLTAWSITITYTAPVFAQGVWTQTPATPNSMFTDAAGTIPYTGAPATTIYVKPLANTTYNVSYTAGACNSASTSVPVSVSQPVTTVSAPSNAAVCHGGTTTFTAAAAAGSPLTYQWQVSTDNGLTFANVSNGALYSGVTTGTLTITGATNAAPNMNGYRYRLNASAAPCAGVVSGGSGTLTVHALPAVTLTASDLQLTPGQTSTLTATSSPAAASYVWRLNGTVISGVTGNTYTADIDKLGTYTVTAVSTSTPACTSTAALAGSVTIGSEASNKLWIYPNPNNGVFQVRLYYPTNNSSSISERRAVYIYNAIGEIVATNEFALTNNTPQYLRMDFDLSRLATGTYAVKVVDKVTGKITSGLFVKQ